MRPLIALLTDFGSRDHYAGTMKGVILGICPDVTLVDVTHDVPPHDVLTGALELGAAYKYFPVGTIFVNSRCLSPATAITKTIWSCSSVATPRP